MQSFHCTTIHFPIGTYNCRQEERRDDDIRIESNKKENQWPRIRMPQRTIFIYLVNEKN